MAEVEVISSLLGEREEGVYYLTPEAHQPIVRDIFYKFRESQLERDRRFEFFDGKTLIEVIDESVRRFISTKSERDGIEDWQARVNDPFTRNKIVAVLGKVVNIMPVSELIGVGTEDWRRARILSDLKSHADYLDDNDELLFFSLLEAVVKGTVVGYEGYEEKTKPVRDIVKYDDAEEITLKEGKKIVRKVFGAIVPLEDFYPSSVAIRKISDMPYCFWRSDMTFSQFNMKFSQYTNARFVKPYSTNSDTTAEKPFYADYISTDIADGNVEVIRYYNQDTDEYVILANGIWLNPMNGDMGGVMPLPFAHKRLPFWKFIFEPIGNWFYGMGVPTKLKSLQDVLNVLHNMMLDQSFLSIFAPMLVSGDMDDIEDDFLVPGRRIPVNDVNGYKQLQVATPNNFHSFILQYTKRALEESSFDSVQQGVAGTGSDRTTATEIQQAAQAVAAILSMFIQFAKWGVRDKDRLRAMNIQQFYGAPLIQSVLGEDGVEEFNKAFNIIKVEDTFLSNGKRGTKIIEMYRSREDMPTAKQLMVEAGMIEAETGRRTEKVSITPEYIRNFEFDIKMVPNPRANESKALNKAMFVEFARFYLEAFPEFVDKENLAAEGAEIFGYSPERFLKKEMLNPQEQPGAELGGGMGMTQNMLAGAAGAEQMATTMGGLSGQMQF